VDELGAASVVASGASDEGAALLAEGAELALFPSPPPVAAAMITTRITNS
jgi:hypothetical protein